MRIGIIGMGTVGKAVFHANSQCDIIIRDPALANSAPLSQFSTCDGIYVCVPSPPDNSGKCDTSILEKTLRDLKLVILNNPIPIICKTTAPPSAYESLHLKYPSIVHYPEFLTAANSNSDYANSTRSILGGDAVWCNRARYVISHTRDPKHEFITTNIKTAALYKYMMNSYLATKVTFMNDFKLLADTLNVNWDELTACATTDDRIGNTHLQIPGPDGKYGWEGACFPKDISAIIQEAIQLNANLQLLNSIVQINQYHRTLT